jgi:hypothetical protein
MKVNVCLEIAGRTSVSTVHAPHPGLSCPTKVHNRPDQRQSPLDLAPDEHLAGDNQAQSLRQPSCVVTRTHKSP